jgi:hypothetical protein
MFPPVEGLLTRACKSLRTGWPRLRLSPGTTRRKHDGRSAGRPKKSQRPETDKKVEEWRSGDLANLRRRRILDPTRVGRIEKSRQSRGPRLTRSTDPGLSPARVMCRSSNATISARPLVRFVPLLLHARGPALTEPVTQSVGFSIGHEAREVAKLKSTSAWSQAPT